ncbi:hypothetical protein PV10_07923 [Exophiala mesophila]|uniref:Uncharacterized protein n=1 Tax=Exophiala mesophila TaxID=212818 RepID=A0A0D1WNN4_EXOME|nr:uncharacterized protein PV10_07923 [Exophiala mesophila]KIV90640.1 hypothetical protein PV10_07923 [Exophiala mesophila]
MFKPGEAESQSTGQGVPIIFGRAMMLLSKRIVILCAALVIFTLGFRHVNEQNEINLWSSTASKSSTNPYPSPHQDGAPTEDVEDLGAFRRRNIQGFQNTGVPGGAALGHNLTCSTLTHSAEIGVQDSFYLYDDLIEVAAELDGHPMVEYTDGSAGRNGGGSFALADLVTTSWSRLATACTFMPDYGVYLCVSRIIFHPDGHRNRCRMSFLRGQIYSDKWVHLHGHKIVWKEQEITFPKVFDTSSEYKLGGEYYGPEDARIIIEEGVEGAEPVVVFNMITSLSDWKRAMWIFRPFSQTSTILTVKDTERPKKEKNWAPFFVKDLDDPLQDKKVARQPSKHIHFIWRFEPLTILKCQLLTGMCDIVFVQDVDQGLLSTHGDYDGSLRGGTQFLPIPASVTPPSTRDRIFHKQSSPMLQSFVAFPRTHLENAGGCSRAVYRPELVVLTTNTTHFYLSYGSGALDFGPGAIMSEEVLADPCNRGRIMITNSIARWEPNVPMSDGKTSDVMTLTLSVDDATVQVARLSGIWSLIRGLPSMSRYFSQTGHLPEEDFALIEQFGDDDDRELLQSLDPFSRVSAVGWDIRACLEEAALAYVGGHILQVDEAVLQAEAEQAKKLEEEKRQREEEEAAAKKQKEEEEKAKKEKLEEDKAKKLLLPPT